MAATFGGRDRMDLVDDDVLDTAKRLASLRREHQVQRLRRGDQDVGRLFGQTATLVSRRVAGADTDRWLVDRHAEPLSGQANTPQRRPQVLFDINR